MRFQPGVHSPAVAAGGCLEAPRRVGTPIMRAGCVAPCLRTHLGPSLLVLVDPNLLMCQASPYACFMRTTLLQSPAQWTNDNGSWCRTGSGAWGSALFDLMRSVGTRQDASAQRCRHVDAGLFYESMYVIGATTGRDVRTCTSLLHNASNAARSAWWQVSMLIKMQAGAKDI
jgi:hypothetical protein